MCHRWACSKVLSVGWQRILVKSPEEQSKYRYVRKATASLDLGCLCAVGAACCWQRSLVQVWAVVWMFSLVS